MAVDRVVPFLVFVVFFLVGTACPIEKCGGSLNTCNWVSFAGETTLKDFEVVLVISSFVSGPWR